MSDERDMRDGGDAEDKVSGNADPTADDATEQAEASVSRPSGKRSSRRTRTADSSDSAGSAVATVRRTRPAGARSSATASRTKQENVFKRLRRFLREVIAELRKVIWPNRKQMVTYTSVVLVFVVFMVAYISGLDLAFIKGVSWLFG